MNARPLHDRILVQRIEEGEQKVGGIIIPDSAKEKPQQGKILAVGPGRRDENGKLIEMSVNLGRSTRPDMSMGICGEHGGDPASIAFCHQIGLNYVSCSPFRIPIARLAAAQAALN